MRTFDKGTLTEKGNELLVEAAAGKQIEFTRLVIGCGNYDVSKEELINLTALREQRQEFCFMEIEKINESSVLLKAVISNRTIETGYYITEIGIYGKLQGTENEVLYSINIVNADSADFLPPFNGLEPTEINLSCYITIRQDTRPMVTLGDAMDILLNEIDEETTRAIEAEKNNSDAIAAEAERAKEQEAQKADIDSPAFTGKPTAPTPETSTNNEQLATTAFVKAVVNAIVNGAPETMDTLAEIAGALAENETIIAALNEAIGKKLGKTEAAAAASKWATERNINGLIIDGSSNRANYGTCSTPATTAEKTVDCTGFGLVFGAEITVRFTVTNTAANPTLNVGGTGAKPIYYHGATITAGYLAANRTYIFRYNGTQWELVGDVNTAYNNMAGATASADGKSGLVPEPTAGEQEKFLRGDGTWQTPMNTTYSAMTAATESAAGKAGLAPVPEAGKQTAFLRGDGTWVTPSTSLAGNVPGIPADQTAVKALKDQLDAQLSGSLPTINGEKHNLKICSGNERVQINSTGSATITLSQTFTTIAFRLAFSPNFNAFFTDTISENILTVKNADLKGVATYCHYIVIGY